MKLNKEFVILFCFQIASFISLPLQNYLSGLNPSKYVNIYGEILLIPNIFLFLVQKLCIHCSSGPIIIPFYCRTKLFLSNCLICHPFLLNFTSSSVWFSLNLYCELIIFLKSII